MKPFFEWLRGSQSGVEREMGRGRPDRYASDGPSRYRFCRAAAGCLLELRRATSKGYVRDGAVDLARDDVQTSTVN
jgi:hypothetical protein